MTPVRAVLLALAAMTALAAWVSGCPVDAAVGPKHAGRDAGPRPAVAP